MNRVVMSGVSGASPLGFMASVGLLRIASRTAPNARLSFLDDGSFCPVLLDVPQPLEQLVSADADSQAGSQPWRLIYGKPSEKKGTTSQVADLKPPPEVFEGFVHSSVRAWILGHPEGAAYAAAYATTVARDQSGKTKPTALHFTAANQQFLGAIETIRSMVGVDWCRESLFHGGASRPGGNVRWDPAADRNYALMAQDPNADGTSVDAPLEWLAFRGLPLFPTFPVGRRILTTGVTGRGDEMRFDWLLWTAEASLGAVRSLLGGPMSQGEESALLARGVFARCSSEIRRTSQGFGNFGPASISRLRAAML